MTHEPPTTEQMCKVVAIKEGWKKAYFFPDRIAGQSPCFRPEDDYDAEYVKDPRHDDAAAMELLNHILSVYYDHYVIQPGNGWRIYDGPDTLATIPISGEPFRAAVCNLAVKVLLTTGAAQ